MKRPRDVSRPSLCSGGFNAPELRGGGGALVGLPHFGTVDHSIPALRHSPQIYCRRGIDEFVISYSPMDRLGDCGGIAGGNNKTAAAALDPLVRAGGRTLNWKSAHRHRFQRVCADAVGNSHPNHRSRLRQSVNSIPMIGGIGGERDVKRQLSTHFIDPTSDRC